jgi:hypothetical protein
MLKLLCRELARLLLPIVALIPTGISAQAPVPSQSLKGQQLLMANGAMLGVFFHEYGHMLISELKLPLTGPEEDVVDEFSALTLSAMLVEAAESQKAIFEGALLGLALFWDLSAEQQKKRGTGVPFFDEHSPDERRFANILCIAVGADPLRFAPVATRAGFTDARMRRCAVDYKRHRDA